MNTSRPNPNLVQLVAVATKLEPILDQLAFVGGCVTGLLLTDPAAAPVRPTLDVDAIVAIASYAEFTLLENRLRQLGFRESRAEGAPICRWLHGDLILDLMPTDASILGFSNRWYRPALENAQKVRIGDYEIQIITVPYFPATKLEAFHGRGKNDFHMSHDLEDILTYSTDDPSLRAKSVSRPQTCRIISARSSELYYRSVIFWSPYRDTCCPTPPASNGSGWS